MSEKRFTYHEQDIDDMILPCVRENGELIARSVYECYILLNELNDENEQLKKDLKKQFVPFAKADGDYTTVNTEEFIKILNENEQLKQEKQELFDFFMNEYDRQEDESIDREIKLEEHIKSLIDVNEQLKQLVDEAEDIIVCQCTPHYQRKWENIKKNIKGDV